MTVALTAMTPGPEAKAPKAKKARCLRAWFVGAIPFGYLFRHEADVEGAVKTHLYLQTPTMSFTVASPEEADAFVVKLLQSSPPACIGANEQLIADGRRVIFTVASVAVAPTSDAIERAFAPNKFP